MIQRYRGSNNLYLPPHRVANTLPPTWEELFEWLVLNSSVYDDEIADLGEEEVFCFHEEDYYQNLLTLQSLGGEECWRALAITPPHNCNVEYASLLDPLGIYWSRVFEGADIYWSDNDSSNCAFLYRARVSQDSIDLGQSLRMNMINPDEDEIRFLPGSRIWVYDCTIFQGKMWSMDEEVIEINDWRRC